MPDNAKNQGLTKEQMVWTNEIDWTEQDSEDVRRMVAERDAKAQEQEQPKSEQAAARS